MRLARHSLPFLLLIVAITTLGCGPSEATRHPVSGTVKWKGQLIKSGTINFRSEDGKHFATGTIVEGKYDIPAISGLPVGKYAVAISYPDPKVPAPNPDEPPGPAAEAREMLPAKYADGTELKAEIKSGSNDVSFDLQ
jgi:hypothetical protein